MLYTFEKLKQFLDQYYPDKQTVIKNNLIVKGENFTQKYIDNKVHFRDNGIFININGIDFPRYIYLKKYFVNQYNKLPVFHIIKCSVVNDLGSGHFSSASSPYVDIFNRDTNKMITNVKLNLCKYCQTEIVNTYRIPLDTEAFHNNVKIFELENFTIPSKDLYGYSFNWNEISTKYKKIKNYTCECCGFKPDSSFDNRFIHTHHIDGNKLKYDNNLVCLCILCHSKKDEKHLKNFEKHSQQKELNDFLKKYQSKLIEIQNPYIEY